MKAGALEAVRVFWDEASCGEMLLLRQDNATGYAAQSAERYRLEPYIPSFASWATMSGKEVLEIGVGLGSDHEQFAKAGAILSGVDLTPRAVEHTDRRLMLSGLSSDLTVANAEELPFGDASFDHVYSWGVLHHSPDTPRAVAEAMRVLRPGGSFAIMVYNKWSLVGLMLWARYALARGKPFTSLNTIYAQHLESPGTKAFTPVEARALFAPYARKLDVKVELTHGDLLSSGAGQRHEGRMLDVARRVWPRRLLARIARNNGLFLLISGLRT